MQRSKMKLTLMGITAVVISGMSISCTKEVPYKYEYKEKVENKLDTSEAYVMVASSDKTNHDDSDASGAMPYWQGQEKIVKFRYTEKSLQAVQIDTEDRLKDNETNEKVVFEIPGKHVEYRCAQDSYRKCTNREEENNEIPWQKKKQFQPNFDGLKIVGPSLLPIEMDQVFGTSCFAEQSSRFLGYEMNDEAINIQVEKVFKGDMSCLGEKGVQITGLGDLTSQIIYHYSFVKLSKMASAGYKGLNYPVKDEGLFGFFTTDERKYDVAYNRLEKNKIQLMNRWNPARKTIDYYLTDNFNKPEFASIKEATQIAFNRVNKGLKSAGVDLQLNLKDPAGKSPGDIRNSMVVLVEDPVAGGPLGYGPSVANPLTGEIMSARVGMYYGNLLQGVKRTYDEVVMELRRDRAAGKAQKLSFANETAEAEESLEKSRSHFKVESSMLARMMKSSMKSRSKVAQPIGQAKKTDRADIQIQKFAAVDLKKLTKGDFERLTLQSDKSSSVKDTLAAMSKHCNYPSELFPFAEAIKTGLQGELGQDLKLWNDLSESEKSKVIAKIAPEIWIPTLVHELGHNLGLRHNFGGSEDKENFYTTEELAAMDVHHKVPYSSVMDYGYSELNLLPTLGKYDIAALRFGYKREIETTTGKFVKISGTAADLKAKQALEFKDYQYCSDEHVEVNPNCKRFDQGTNVVEIMNFLEKSYDDMYSYRNFRNGRENFSKFSDAAYAASVRSRFAYIRAFMERYESIKYRFNLADDAKEWTTIPFLKELKEAAVASGKFFVKVMTTPDIMCAIAAKSNPSTIVGVLPLADYNSDGINCFKDLALNAGYVTVAQAGKAFNHKKDAASDNHYADQIDVRGVYIDKIVAVEKLFNRRVGNSSFDKNEDNYLDLPGVTEPIEGALMAMLTNSLVVNLNFKDANGVEVLTAPVQVPVFASPDDLAKGKSWHWIEKVLDKSIADAIGIPMRSTSFQEVMLSKINRGLGTSQTTLIADRNFMDKYRVVKTNKAYQVDKSEGAIVHDIGTLRLVALPENAMAHDILQLVQLKTAVMKLTEKEQGDLLNARMSAEALSGGRDPEFDAESPFSRELQAIPAALLSSILKGSIDTTLFEYLVTILPASN